LGGRDRGLAPPAIEIPPAEGGLTGLVYDTTLIPSSQPALGAAETPALPVSLHRHACLGADSGLVGAYYFVDAARYGGVGDDAAAGGGEQLAVYEPE